MHMRVFLDSGFATSWRPGMTAGGVAGSRRRFRARFFPAGSSSGLPPENKMRAARDAGDFPVSTAWCAGKEKHTKDFYSPQPPRSSASRARCGGLLCASPGGQTFYPPLPMLNTGGLTWLSLPPISPASVAESRSARNTQLGPPASHARDTGHRSRSAHPGNAFRNAPLVDRDALNIIL
jgi:hypothetical protein